MTTSTPLKPRRGLRPRRPIQALEQRRLAAAELFAAGATQAQVARELGVSPQSAHRWHARWKSGGTAALHAPARQGGPSKLSTADWHAVEQTLDAGAEAAWFESDLWTLKRVAAVIERLTGVAYSIGHVWWLLRGHGWSPQRPIRRASERDEQAIARWVAEDWPRIQQTPRAAAMDRLPGRIRAVADPAGAPHLGAARGHTNGAVARCCGCCGCANGGRLRPQLRACVTQMSPPRWMHADTRRHQ